MSIFFDSPSNIVSLFSSIFIYVMEWHLILILCFYRFVTVIMNVTATIAMEIPTMIFVVSGSPNMTVPTTMAVIGSKTPRTDAFVAPILRDAMAKVAVETIVGNSARPIRLSQSVPVVIPAVMAVPEKMIFPMNTIAPTVRA